MTDNICKCGSKMALGNTYVTVAEWHSEPYEDEKQEKVVFKNGEESLSPNIDISIAFVQCPDCDRIKWLSIEESVSGIEEVINHAKPKGEETNDDK